MSGGLARYVRSGGWGVLAQLAQLVLALAASVVVVRWLGAADFGRLTLARQVLLFLVVLGGLSLERALLRFLPELRSAGRGRGARRLLSDSLGIRIGAGVGLFALAWPLAPWAASILGEGLTTPLRVAAGCALAFSAFAHLRAAATASLAMREVALATTVAALLSLGLTVVALANDRGVEGVLLANALGLLVGAGMLWGPARRHPAREGPDDGGGIALGSRRFLAYAAPFALIGLLNHLVHSRTEVLFLGAFHGPEEAAWFGLGFEVAQRAVDFVPLALWELSMAGFATAVVQRPARVPGLLRDYVILLYLVLFPLVATGIALAPPAFALLYEVEMAPAIPVAQAYFAIALVTAAGAPLGMVVYARERVSLALRAYLLFALANIGLDLLLIPSFGLVGAVVALGAAKLLALFLMARIALGELPSLPLPWSFLGRGALATLPVLAWWPISGQMPPGPALVAGIAWAMLCLPFSFRWLRVVGEEEAALLARAELPGAARWLPWLSARGQA